MLKKTKIIATISDLNCDPLFLKSLIDEGADAFRLNTAHQSPDGSLKIINNIRKVSKKIPIIIDTKGPEIRTCKLEGEPISLKKGDPILFKGDPKMLTTSKCIYINYPKFHEDLKKGTRFLYDDGKIEFLVKEKKDSALVCEAKNAGEIQSGKSINIPGVSTSLPSLSKKDREYVEFSIKHKIDFIAHSFVRNKKDLLDIQTLLNKTKAKIRLIAKIENGEGIDNLEEIFDHCEGVMVARGDLGVEIPAEKIPAIQKGIIEQCIERKKIVITATQMLQSMVKNPKPTRAEISDVANAVYDGTDCVMLSDETAIGSYPLESVRIMSQIAKEVENEKRKFSIEDIANRRTKGQIHGFIANAAIRASASLPVQALITKTIRGRTVRYLSSFRGDFLIHTLCISEEVMRALALRYAVYADTVPRQKEHRLVQGKIKDLLKRKLITKEDLIIILTGSSDEKKGPSSLTIGSTDRFLK